MGIPTDTSYNPQWELTPETEKYLRLVFAELEDPEFPGRVKASTLVTQVRRHALITEDEVDELEALIGDTQHVDFAGWVVLVLGWKEIHGDAAIEAMWQAWVNYRLGPAINLVGPLRGAAAESSTAAGAQASNDPKNKEGQSKGKRDTSALLKRMLAGGLAGMAAKSITAPVDRIKILFQVTSRRFSFPAAGQLFLHVCRTEGPLALWRGNNAQLLRVFPYAGIQFMCYDFYKAQLKGSLHYAEQGSGLPVTAVENLLAGAFAGATSVACTYPLDLLRARLAVEEGAKSRFSGLGAAIWSMYLKEGATGFYRGVTPTLLGILPYAGIAFAANDLLRTRASLIGSNSNGSGGGGGGSGGGQSGQVSTVTKLACGGLAGLLAQSVTYPLETVRRRQQTEGYVSVPAAGAATTATSAGEGRAAGAGAAAAAGAGVRAVGGAEASLAGAGVSATATATVRTATATATATASSASAAVSSATAAAAVPLHTMSMADTVKLILRTEGARGLFKGLAVNWVKAPVSIGVSFTLFDWFKEALGVEREHHNE